MHTCHICGQPLRTNEQHFAHLNKTLTQLECTNAVCDAFMVTGTTDSMVATVDDFLANPPEGWALLRARLA